MIGTDTLDVTVISSIHVRDHVEEWPFVELSSFQERATYARHLSGVLQISMCPLVVKENLQDWETYVNTTADGWM